jgi:hypothetical protein
MVTSPRESPGDLGRDRPSPQPAGLFLRGAHHIEQCCYIDLRVSESRGCLGIRDLFNSPFDFSDPQRALRQVTHVAREKIHEVVGSPRCWFQLVTIKAIVFEVHEGIARLPKTRTQRSQVSSNLRPVRTR